MLHISSGAELKIHNIAEDFCCQNTGSSVGACAMAGVSGVPVIIVPTPFKGTIQGIHTTKTLSWILPGPRMERTTLHLFKVGLTLHFARAPCTDGSAQARGYWVRSVLGQVYISALLVSSPGSQTYTCTLLM